MDIERTKAFISETHSEIEGWFFPLDQLAFFELVAVQNQMQVGGDLVEVGVYHGKSLVLLSLLKKEEEKLLGFDLFDADHKERTQDNLNNFGRSEQVTLVRGYTSEIAQGDLDKMLPSPLRFLHIDAGHEYHEVLEQLRLFSPYVADRGIIAMDDYQDREFPGIEAAVLDFAEFDRPRRFVPFLAGGNKVFLCCSSMATAFQTLLIGRPNFKDTCRLTRVRDFNVLIMRSKLPVKSQTIADQLARLNFPRRTEADLLLGQKSALYSQVTFGSGK
jgi:cephalosporin hydroxylase